MEILSHRGYWLAVDEKNSELAFRRSFSIGFGTETDVRDCGGNLVISHDMPTGTEMSFDAFLSIYVEYSRDLTLAINIKADGLGRRVQEAMARFGVTRWFTFDMSVPDFMQQTALGLPAFCRRSDVEPASPQEQVAAGVWLDSFEEGEVDVEVIKASLGRGKRVCVVSPELHGRAQAACWASLRKLADETRNARGHTDGLMLCTDVPEDAKRYFEAHL